MTSLAITLFSLSAVFYLYIGVLMLLVEWDESGNPWKAFGPSPVLFLQTVAVVLLWPVVLMLSVLTVQGPEDLDDRGE